MSFLGMRGNDDWATDVREKSWRRALLHINPNGKAPLTALTALASVESLTDPEHSWWTKTLPKQFGDLTTSGVYKENTLANKYTEGVDAQPALGDVFYVSAATGVVKHFRVGHGISLEKTNDYRYRTRGEVIDRGMGSSPFIGFRLLEASSDTYDIDEVDRVQVVGNINSEGAERPDGIQYDPVKYYNYTQIFRTPLSITNTAKNTNLRTGDGYMEAKREALELHGIEIEKAMLFGVRSETTGDNGKPKRTMDGIITALRREETANGNVDGFGFTAPYTTADWSAVVNGVARGESWLDDFFEVIFRHGDPEKLALCGSGAVKAINTLAKVSGTINLTEMSTSFGMQVTRWITPFGTVFLKTHPLMSQNPQTRNDMLILEPRHLKFRPLQNRDTQFIPDGGAASNNGRDSTEEEYLTEGTLQYDFPLVHGYLTRLGLNN